MRSAAFRYIDDEPHFVGVFFSRGWARLLPQVGRGWGAPELAQAGPAFLSHGLVIVVSQAVAGHNETRASAPVSLFTNQHRAEALSSGPSWSMGESWVLSAPFASDSPSHVRKVAMVSLNEGAQAVPVAQRLLLQQHCRSCLKFYACPHHLLL